MFVFSLKASRLKAFCILMLCVFGFAVILSVLPEAGASVNVNKIEGVKELSKIDVKTDEGRMEYFAALGYGVDKNAVSTAGEMLPKELDGVLLKYNKLQRAQGYDISKYCGKKLKSYSYSVSSFPDDTNFEKGDYIATIICYKNKVVAADLYCKSTDKCMPLIKAI